MSTAWFAVADATFLVFFSAEVFLRLLAEELFFFLGGSWSWNCFDLIVVLSALLDARRRLQAALSKGRSQAPLLRGACKRP